MGSAKKKWLIGGAIAAGVIVVGSVGAAIGGSGSEPVAETSPTAAATPTAEPLVPTTEPVAQETTEPQPPVEADPVAFRAQANSHLNDMNKDLDDLVVTVQEDGFWRLLSNLGELTFNLAQLEALDLPASGAQTWPESLIQLETALDGLSDAITTQDGATILASVDAVRGQVAATRAVADAVQ